MKTKAVRIYGKGDLRLEEFELLAPRPLTQWDIMVSSYRGFELLFFISSVLLILVFFLFSIFAKEIKKHQLHTRMLLISIGIHWFLNLSFMLMGILRYCNSWDAHGMGELPSIAEITGEAVYKMYLSAIITTVSLILLGILRLRREKYEMA